MRYQDLKIRDAVRLAAMSVGSASAIGLSMVFRDTVEPVVNMLPMRSNEPFLPLIYALAFLAGFSAAAAVYYLWSSPEHNAKFIAWMASKGWRAGEKFDPALLDSSDPDFYVSTWSYLKRRRKSSSL